MTLNEKALATIIVKYGSYEEYVKQRYYNPEKAEVRQRVARNAAYHHKGKRGFNMPGVAKRAVNKRWGKVDKD